MKISVFGGSKTPAGSPDYQEALALGRGLAQAGHTVLTGGYRGTMEAVSRGAAEAGGQAIGVTCGEIESWRGVQPNPWLTEGPMRHAQRAPLLSCHRVRFGHRLARRHRHPHRAVAHLELDGDRFHSAQAPPVGLLRLGADSARLLQRVGCLHPRQRPQLFGLLSGRGRRAARGRQIPPRKRLGLAIIGTLSRNYRRK